MIECLHWLIILLLAFCSTCFSVAFEKNRLCLDSRDHFGKTPLHYASGRGHLEIIQALVNIKDMQGRNPLHDANNSEVFKFLVSRGSDPDLEDDQGITAFQSLNGMDLYL